MLEFSVTHSKLDMNVVHKIFSMIIESCYLGFLFRMNMATTCSSESVTVSGASYDQTHIIQVIF